MQKVSKPYILLTEAAGQTGGRREMRISTMATVVLVLLGVAVGYYLGAQRRNVEPDAYGVAKRKIALSNRYDCEVFAVGLNEPECEPLTFAQVHAAGIKLVPRDSGCSDSGRDSNN
jgi:hypothetical protein